jgi:hypothetical protein
MNFAALPAWARSYLGVTVTGGYIIGLTESLNLYCTAFERKHGYSKIPTVSTLSVLGFAGGCLGAVTGPVLTPVYGSFKLYKAYKDIAPKED